MHKINGRITQTARPYRLGKTAVLRNPYNRIAEKQLFFILAPNRKGKKKGISDFYIS